MKRIMCGAAALLLALLLCGQALAAGSAEPVRTFVYEDTLYTYVRLEGIDSPVTQVEAKIGAQSFPASSRLEAVRQAGFPITYLLLVDNSNSMPPFRAQLEEFCKELAAEIFSSGCKKVHCFRIVLVMDGADVAYLRAALFVYGGKSQNSYIF